MKVILRYIICITLFISLKGCSGCSHSGRVNSIKQALIEGKKKPTVPTPKTIIKNKTPQVEEVKDIVTPAEQKKINDDLIRDKIGPVKGRLIQVEGLVLKEVRELTIQLNMGSSRIEQIIKMKEYVHKNWHYIYDPSTDGDTFRSAEATIALKYRNKYPGDCDDYAILLASFARQIGLQARVMAGFDDGSGHAFAEFKISEDQLSNRYLQGYDTRVDSHGDTWVSLDWFRGEVHNKFLRNLRILIDAYMDGR